MLLKVDVLIKHNGTGPPSGGKGRGRWTKGSCVHVHVICYRHVTFVLVCVCVCFVEESRHREGANCATQSGYERSVKGRLTVGVFTFFVYF